MPAKKKAKKRSTAGKATKPAAKKPAAKKPAAKKPAAKKPAAKKPAAKKPAAKKPAAMKPAAMKPAAAAGLARDPGVPQHPVTPQQMAAVAAQGLRSDGEILQVEVAEVAPCRLVDHGGGRYSLCFDDYAMPEVPLFAQLGLQGGGYTWEAVVHSLVKRRYPALAAELAYDSEAGMFVAIGSRAALVTVAKLIQAALADPLVLRTAVESADPDSLE